MIIKMKRIVIMMMTLFLCLGISGCALVPQKEELSDEEVVNTFLQAYQNGDYEAIKPFISDDNKLHTFFSVLTEGNGNGMEEVFKRVHELTKDFTFTAKAVEGKERWGEVSVKIQTKDISGNILTAMSEAIASEVANNDDSFKNMPAWMLKAIETAEPVEKEMTVYVGNRDGENVMDTNTNREFFDLLNGGFYYYIYSTMTTCSNKYDAFEIFAKGDEILGMVETAQLIDMSDDELQAYLAPFQFPGVNVQATHDDEGITMKLGVDFETASSKRLADLNIISNRITASGGYLSLRTTVKDFYDSAMDCETVYGLSQANKSE